MDSNSYVIYDSKIIGAYTPNNNLDDSASSSSSIPRIDHISFYFSYIKITQRLVPNSDQDSSTELIMLEPDPPQRFFNAILDFPCNNILALLSIRQTIENELRGWNLPQDVLLGLIYDVLLKTRRYMINNGSAEHNGLVIFVDFMGIFSYNTDSMDDIMRRLSIEESMVSNNNYMVPATDSSIESLKSKVITQGCDDEDDESSSCSICLEEFCGGCEALCMPCSHVFHGDCIKKWLKTSHYCPICRYEMPTN